MFLTDLMQIIINAQLRKVIPQFTKSSDIDIRITGEQEDQKESMVFLSKAMILALFLIMFILITQFNSMSKALIIISEVIFSLIGVLLGYMIFGMTISIIMTGMGIVALAGIVVRNGILLVEFTDVLKEQGVKTRKAIIRGRKDPYHTCSSYCNCYYSWTYPIGNRNEYQLWNTVNRFKSTSSFRR